MQVHTDLFLALVKGAMFTVIILSDLYKRNSYYWFDIKDLCLSTLHAALSTLKVQVVKLMTPSAEEEFEHNLEAPGTES